MKKYSYKLSVKPVLIAMGIGLFAAICFALMSGFVSDCDDIRESVLRLHILANSDTEEDQNLKLAVRDKILSETENIFYTTSSVGDAKEKASKSIAQIEQIAQQELSAQGYDYTVKAEVCNMFFDTRVYQNFSLPAGHYDALRITIGQAKGHNWWCVLYPPMCLPSAMPKEELKKSGLSAEQENIIEKPQEYKVEFAVVEVFEKIKDFVKG